MMKAFVALLALGVCGAPLAAQSVVNVEPSEETYVQLVVAATGWAKKTVSKSVGVVLPADAPAPLLHAIEAAAKQHDLKRIPLVDYGIYCVRHEASRSAPTYKSCTMKGADAVLQFAEVRVAGDSGSVVTSITRVPKGGDKPETARYCIQLAKQGADWLAARGDTVSETAPCPKPIR